MHVAAHGWGSPRSCRFAGQAALLPDRDEGCGHAGRTDSLTGLMNRGAFLDVPQQILRLDREDGFGRIHPFPDLRGDSLELGPDQGVLVHLEAGRVR